MLGFVGLTALRAKPRIRARCKYVDINGLAGAGAINAVFIDVLTFVKIVFDICKRIAILSFVKTRNANSS
jgi:hypothetical protein